MNDMLKKMSEQRLLYEIERAQQMLERLSAEYGRRHPERQREAQGAREGE